MAFKDKVLHKIPNPDAKAKDEMIHALKKKFQADIMDVHKPNSKWVILLSGMQLHKIVVPSLAFLLLLCVTVCTTVAILPTETDMFIGNEAFNASWLGGRNQTEAQKATKQKAQQLGKKFLDEWVCLIY